MVAARCLIGFVFLISVAFAAPLLAQERSVGLEHFSDLTLDVAGRIQTVATQDVDGDGLPDLIVIHHNAVDGVNRRYLSIFLQKKTIGFACRPDQTFTPDPSAAAVSFLHLEWEKGLVIVCFRGDGAFYYAWNGTAYDLQPKRLLFAPTFFRTPQADALPVLYYPVDIDKNGLDDLLVPQFDGYRIYFQHAGGKFGRITPISIQGGRSVEQGGGNYLVANYHVPLLEIQDFNGDWRKDLIACSGHRFMFWLQDEKGGFPAQPSGAFDLEFLKTSAQRDRVQASFLTLEDIDGDQCADLLVSHTTGDIGVFESLVTRVLLFRGRQGQPYAETPDQILNLKGVSIDPHLVDVNGDGKLDLVVSSFRTDLLGAAKSALMKAVNISYYIFLYDAEKGHFADDSSYDRMVTIPTDQLEKGGRGLPHIYFSGDFDGDKRNDMVTMSGEGQLGIYRGREVKGLLHSSNIGFEKDEWFLKTLETPKAIEIRDFNRDGRSDLMLKYGSRVRIFLSR